jgi:hypothetical protein
MSVLTSREPPLSLMHMANNSLKIKGELVDCDLGLFHVESKAQNYSVES